MVKNLKAFLPAKALHQVGNSLINSIIQYGAALWGATSDQNILRVQKAQTRAARLLTRKPSAQYHQMDLCHRQDMFTTIKWLNVNQLIQSASLNLIRNAINQNSSIGMNAMFKVSHLNSNLRNKSIRVDHRGPPGRNNLTFSANATQMFNNLPNHLKLKNINPYKFKNMLKQHILSENHLQMH